LEKVVGVLVQFSDIDALNHRRETPFRLAIPTCSRRLVKILLEAGANPNISDVQGDSPWTICLDRTDFTSLASLFLSCKADPNACNKRGWTPLHFAARYWDIGLATALLRDHGVNPEAATIDLKETALHKACWMDCEPMVRLLLRHHANCNAVDAVGRTPLHCAFNTLPIVRLLVEEFGADVDVPDNHGDTPLMYALFQDEPESGAFLIAHANPNVKNLDGLFPLYVAVDRQIPWAVKGLIKANVALNPRTDSDRDRLSILELACTRGSHEIVQYLLAHGVDTSLGYPLHVACHKGHAHLIPLLFRQNPGLIHVVDREGRTALHIAACYRGMLSIVEPLVAHGVDLFAQDTGGYTAFDLACRNGHMEVIFYFLRRHNWLAHLRHPLE
jgi:ankyrin repeat protein